MQLRRLSAALVAVVSLAALSGCGNSASTDDDAKGPGTQRQTPVLLSAASFGKTMAQAQAKAQSMHVTGEVAVAGQTASMTMNASIGKNPSLKTIAMDMTMDMGAQGKLQMRLVDSSMYLTGTMLPAASKPWVRFDLGDPKNPFGQMMDQMLSSVDPDKVEDMYASIKRLEDLGPETVDGVDTRHYSVTVNMQDAIKALGMDKVKGISLQDVLKQLPKTYTSDVWLDSAQRPVQMKYSLSGSETVMHYSDWGKPVSIKAPPASQVRTVKL